MYQLSSRNISSYAIVRGFALISPFPRSHSETSAKEKRKCYTLGPVPDATTGPSEASGALAAPPHSPQPPAIPVSHLLPATGPDRTKRVSKQPRLRTGPLPAHLKERVLANIANAKTRRVVGTQIDVPVVEPPPRYNSPDGVASSDKCTRC